jgi:hypothetical protein
MNAVLESMDGKTLFRWPDGYDTIGSHANLPLELRVRWHNATVAANPRVPTDNRDGHIVASLEDMMDTDMHVDRLPFVAEALQGVASTVKGERDVDVVMACVRLTFGLASASLQHEFNFFTRMPMLKLDSWFRQRTIHLQDGTAAFMHMTRTSPRMTLYPILTCWEHLMKNHVTHRLGTSSADSVRMLSIAASLLHESRLFGAADAYTLLLLDAHRCMGFPNRPTHLTDFAHDAHADMIALEGKRPASSWHQSLWCCQQTFRRIVGECITQGEDSEGLKELRKFQVKGMDIVFALQEDEIDHPDAWSALFWCAQMYVLLGRWHRFGPAELARTVEPISRKFHSVLVGERFAKAAGFLSETPLSSSSSSSSLSSESERRRRQRKKMRARQKLKGVDSASASASAAAADEANRDDEADAEEAEVEEEEEETQALSAADDVLVHELISNLEGLTVQQQTAVRRAEDLEDRLDAKAQCVICRDTNSDVVLLPCKHLCMCTACSKAYSKHTCPLCRKSITQRISGVLLA